MNSTPFRKYYCRLDPRNVTELSISASRLATYVNITVYIKFKILDTNFIIFLNNESVYTSSTRYSSKNISDIFD
jgi:hypothetical protein